MTCINLRYDFRTHKAKQCGQEAGTASRSSKQTVHDNPNHANYSQQHRRQSKLGLISSPANDRVVRDDGAGSGAAAGDVLSGVTDSSSSQVVAHVRGEQANVFGCAGAELAVRVVAEAAKEEASEGGRDGAEKKKSRKTLEAKKKQGHG